MRNNMKSSSELVAEAYASARAKVPVRPSRNMVEKLYEDTPTTTPFLAMMNLTQQNLIDRQAAMDELVFHDASDW